MGTINSWRIPNFSECFIFFMRLFNAKTRIHRNSSHTSLFTSIHLITAYYLFLLGTCVFWPGVYATCKCMHSAHSSEQRYVLWILSSFTLPRPIISELSVHRWKMVNALKRMEKYQKEKIGEEAKTLVKVTNARCLLSIHLLNK